MGVLSGLKSDDPSMQRLLRILDERLSEILSIHGKQSSRGGIDAQRSKSYEGDGTNSVLIDQENKGTVFGSTFFQQSGPSVVVADTDKVPARRALYPDQVLWAYALTGATGTVIRGINLECSNTATGRYTYTFKRPMDSIAYAIVPIIGPGALPIIDGGTIITQNGANLVTAVSFPPQIQIVGTPSATSFNIETLSPNNNTWAYINHKHQVYVYGIPA